MAYLIFILAAVMGIAGVFGGLINYYQMTQDRGDEAALPRCIVMGIGASLLVPVILLFVQSDLITDIQSDPSKLLIYTRSPERRAGTGRHRPLPRTPLPKL